MSIINIYEAFVFGTIIISVLIYIDKMNKKEICLYAEGAICKIAYVVSFIVLVFDLGVDDQGFANVINFFIWTILLSFMLALIEVLMFIAYAKASVMMFKAADVLICFALMCCAYLTRHEPALLTSIISVAINIAGIIYSKRKKHI